ncbi:flagellar assembly protein FliX [Roseibium aestuarii]|uniref:Flagellar assembly protein FliX n=1 Tax=Roseibium aestuarii TaxID=2600299 RepID=A0ABW4JXF2_9HYPH|nr:flagellar assembly protein FliX [Roseibium aestuarii]
MRITGQNPLTGVQGRGGKKRTDGTSGGFSLESEEPATHSSGTTGTSGLHGMDALLSLQEVEEQPRRKRSPAAQRGYDLLDTLDQLKADLLAGRVSEDRLERLVSRLGDEIPEEDEQVAAVLKEIELRARVELAKLGRF